MAFKKKAIAETAQSAPVYETPQEELSLVPEAAPILTSFSMQKLHGYWHVVTITSQGNKVLKVDLGKPAPKSATLIQFRIIVGKYMMKFN